MRVTFNEHEKALIELRGQIEILKGQLETAVKEKSQLKVSINKLLFPLHGSVYHENVMVVSLVLEVNLK